MIHSNNPLQWGQTKTIAPGDWALGKPIPLVNLDSLQPLESKKLLTDASIIQKAASYVRTVLGRNERGSRVPRVQNISLSVGNMDENTGSCILRWMLTFGAGGANAQILIDANGFQQISVSAEMLRIALVATSLGVESQIPFSAPTQALEASCFFADGNTATDAPTYTEFFTLGTDSSLLLYPPAGATSFRVLGDPASSSPFTADVSYTALYPGALTGDVYVGDEVFDVRLSPMPISGNCNALQITNSSEEGGVLGGIAWEIDL